MSLTGAATFASWLMFVRICIVFPLLALGQPDALKLAWRLGAGNVWRLFWILFWVALPLFVVKAAFALSQILLILADGPVLGLPMAAVGTAFFMAAGIVGATALSRLILMRTDPGTAGAAR